MTKITKITTKTSKTVNPKRKKRKKWGKNTPTITDKWQIDMEKAVKQLNKDNSILHFMFIVLTSCYKEEESGKETFKSYTQYINTYCWNTPDCDKFEHLQEPQNVQGFHPGIFPHLILWSKMGLIGQKAYPLALKIPPKLREKYDNASCFFGNKKEKYGREIRRREEKHESMSMDTLYDRFQREEEHQWLKFHPQNLRIGSKEINWEDRFLLSNFHEH